MDQSLLAHTWRHYLSLPPMLSYHDSQFTRRGNRHRSPRGNGFFPRLDHPVPTEFRGPEKKFEDDPPGWVRHTAKPLNGGHSQRIESTYPGNENEKDAAHIEAPPQGAPSDAFLPASWAAKITFLAILPAALSRERLSSIFAAWSAAALSIAPKPRTPLTCSVLPLRLPTRSSHDDLGHRRLHYCHDR